MTNANAAMQNAAEIRLNPYQDGFIFSPKRYTAIVAGVGTGKTFASLFRAWKYCQQWPGSLGLIVRREFTDLRDSTIKDFQNYFNVQVGAQNHDYKFPNGSIIMFRHGEMTDINVLKNINLSFFSIEQAEEYENADIFDFLRDRLRRKGGPRWGALIANANGHNWIYERFISGAECKAINEETREYVYSKGGEYLCFTASSFANAHNLPDDFTADLRSMEEEAPGHYKQYVLNDFNAVDADDLVFAPEELESMRMQPPSSASAGKICAGAYLARFGKDKSVCMAVRSIGGVRLMECAMDAWNGKDGIYSAGRIADFLRSAKAEDAAVDCDGLGGPIYDSLKDLINGSMGLREFHNAAEKGAYANARTAAYFGLKDLAAKGWLHLSSQEIINELAGIRYTYSRSGQKMLIPKETLRAKGLKSPDYADALAMAYWCWRQTSPSRTRTGRAGTGMARRNEILTDW